MYLNLHMKGIKWISY